MNFNSIKVRLERAGFLERVYQDAYFNSIKVRLEQLHQRQPYNKALFQFHKGTIRTRSCKDKQTFKCNFNSIKVRLEPSIRVELRMASAIFQFHKGTIRTVSLASVMESKVYFNSIKVRLERFRACQSKKQSKFQFHKGTIRT